MCSVLLIVLYCILLFERLKKFLIDFEKNPKNPAKKTRATLACFFLMYVLHMFYRFF